MNLNTIVEVKRPGHSRRSNGATAMPGWPAAPGCSPSRRSPRDTLVDLERFGWPALDRRRRRGWRSPRPAGSPSCTTSRRRPDWRAAPLFRECCDAFLASFKIWNAATVGGNICMSLPAGADDLADGRARRRLHAVAARRRAARGAGRRLRHRQPRERAAAGRAAAQRSTCRPRRLRKRSAFRQVSLTQLGRSAALLIGTRGRRRRATSC